jgi:hypothetical protein
VSQLSKGQGFVEYALILGLAALVAFVALTFFSPQIAFVLSIIGAEIERST